MGVTIKYGTNTIANLTSSGTKTANTAGKYLSKNIVVQYTADGGDTPATLPSTTYDTYKMTTVSNVKAAGEFKTFVPDIIIATPVSGDTKQKSGVKFDNGETQWSAIVDSGTAKRIGYTVDVNGVKYQPKALSSESNTTLTTGVNLTMIHLPLIVDKCADSTIGSQYSYEQLISGATKLTVPSSAERHYGTTTFPEQKIANNQTVTKKWWTSTSNYPYASNVAGYTDRGTKCSNVIAYYIEARSGFTIENCVFENCEGINAVNCQNFTIRNCVFKNSTAAIHMNRCSGVTIENCTIIGNDSGVYIASEIYTGYGCSNVRIRKCKVIAPSATSKAFRFGNSGYDPVTDAKVENCYIAGAFTSAVFNEGTAEVTVSGLTADLVRSYTSVAANGSPAIFRCPTTGGYIKASNSIINMDYERTRSTNMVTLSGVTFNVVDTFKA